MSLQKPTTRLMAPHIAALKGERPIVALTSYHAHTAAIADKYCDFLLVGDSLGMVMHGYETTVPVPLELMKHQCELGLKWLKAGRIEGICFIGSPMCDMDVEAVEWTRQWIQHVGDQRL